MIPNIFHFCFGMAEDFGGKPFSLAHYIAIKSAYEVNQPEEIFFYYAFEPSGEWWEKSKELVTLRKVVPPASIFGNPLMHVAHMSDVLRLQKLIEFGGIYMDLDTICRKSFAPLLNNKFVIGKQGKWRLKGLCNAVMMAEQNSRFARIWLERYKTFRSKGKDKFWDEHSIRLPPVLAKENPKLIHIEPYNSFHYPLYYKRELKKMFEKVNKYPYSYCHHLWEGASWELYLKKLNVHDIINKDTTYNLLARKFINQ